MVPIWYTFSWPFYTEITLIKKKKMRGAKSPGKANIPYSEIFGEKNPT